VIEQHIDFYQQDANSNVRSVRLPTIFIREYQSQRYDSPLPTVSSICTLPIVMPGGEILSGHRLDRARGILFKVDATLDAMLPRIEACTEDAVAAATAFLTGEWLVDVQGDYTTRMKLVALACTVLERHLFPARPGFLITSSQRGDGKTTALNMLSIAAVGSERPGATWGFETEERRKALLAHLSQGLALLAYDNLPAER
jgi:hypothetical protein